MKVAEALERVVDFGIGLVNPRKAVIRAHFRRMERDEDYRKGVFALMRARGYRASTDDKKKTPWFGSPRSADGEVLYELPKLRNRSRELHRDDPLGAGLLDTLAREIVGTELRAQSRATDKDKAARIESVWEDAKAKLAPADGVPLGQWQRILANKLVEDGEAIVKRSISKPGEPVWFETIEGDRLQTPSDVLMAEGEIRAGVELDKNKRIVAYWILKKHPNDFVPGPSGTGDLSVVSALGSLSKDQFFRVPAESVRHVKLADRPGQTRGVPIFHAVLQDFRDLDLLMLASLKRIQISACLAIFIKSTQTVPDLLPVTAENYGFQLDQDIEPGMCFKLFPNEEIQTLVPNFPIPELEPFIVMIARRIGAAVGVSWQTVLRDWSQSTYSSARTQILADSPTTAVMRHDLRVVILDWIWTTVMEDALLRGDERLAGVTPEDLRSVQWFSDGRPWIDPLKEAQAIQLKLAMRLTTLRDECAALGRDWEEQLRQSLLEEKREIEIRAELELPPRAADVPLPAPAPGAGDNQGDAPPAKKKGARIARPIFGRPGFPGLKEVA